MTRTPLALAAALAVVVACRPRPSPPPVIGNRPGDHEAVAPTHGDITTAGLEALFARRFPSQLAAGTLTREWNGTEDDVLAELAAMGWHDLAQVEAAIPRDFDRRAGVQFTQADAAFVKAVQDKIGPVEDRWATAAEAKGLKDAKKVLADFRAEIKKLEK